MDTLDARYHKIKHELEDYSLDTPSHMKDTEVSDTIASAKYWLNCYNNSLRDDICDKAKLDLAGYYTDLLYVFKV